MSFRKRWLRFWGKCPDCGKFSMSMLGNLCMDFEGCPSWGNRSKEARLAAAAPKLLASLKEVVSAILDYEQSINVAPNPGRKYCWDCVGRAVATIEDATGSPLTRA